MGLRMAEIKIEMHSYAVHNYQIVKIVLITQHRTDIYNTSRKKAQLEHRSHIFHEKCQLQMLCILAEFWAGLNYIN